MKSSNPSLEVRFHFAWKAAIVFGGVCVGEAEVVVMMRGGGRPAAAAER